MTITTNLAAKYGETTFSQRPATSTHEAILTLAAGSALAGLGIWRRGRLGTALGALGGYLLYCGARDFQKPYQGRVRVSYTIQKDRKQVYDFASNPENWGKFMHAIQLERRSESRFAFSLGKPAGIDFESDVEITDQHAGEHIAWASAEQMLEHRGVIRFKPAPGNRGTEVFVALESKVPAGPIARGLASLVGWNPEQVVRESLRHLKQLMEAGEIPTTAGQPSGVRGIRGTAKRIIFREGPTEESVEQNRMAGD
jgi:uncharacterized membrane protein